jgi:hypothetical protein
VTGLRRSRRRATQRSARAPVALAAGP